MAPLRKMLFLFSNTDLGSLWRMDGGRGRWDIVNGTSACLSLQPGHSQKRQTISKRRDHLLWQEK